MKGPRNDPGAFLFWNAAKRVTRARLCEASVCCFNQFHSTKSYGTFLENVNVARDIAVVFEFIQFQVRTDINY
jgi:hypothetical protein